MIITAEIIISNRNTIDKIRSLKRIRQAVDRFYCLQPFRWAALPLLVVLNLCGRRQWATLSSLPVRSRPLPDLGCLGWELRVLCNVSLWLYKLSANLCSPFTICYSLVCLDPWLSSRGSRVPVWFRPCYASGWSARRSELLLLKVCWISIILFFQQPTGVVYLLENVIRRFGLHCIPSSPLCLHVACYTAWLFQRRAVIKLKLNQLLFVFGQYHWQQQC